MNLVTKAAITPNFLAWIIHCMLNHICPAASWHNLSAFSAAESLYLNFFYIAVQPHRSLATVTGDEMTMHSQQWLLRSNRSQSRKPCFFVVQMPEVIAGVGNKSWLQYFISILHVHLHSQPEIVPASILWYMLLLSHKWKTSEQNSMMLAFLHHCVPEHSVQDVWCDFGLFWSAWHSGAPTLPKITQLISKNGDHCPKEGLQGSNFKLKFQVEMCTESSVFFVCVTILAPILSVTMINWE